MTKLKDYRDGNYEISETERMVRENHWRGGWTAIAYAMIGWILAYAALTARCY